MKKKKTKIKNTSYVCFSSKKYRNCKRVEKRFYIITFLFYRFMYI